MLLDSTTDSLEILLDKPALSELNFFTYYTDYSTSAVNPTSSYGITNGTASVNLVPPPLTGHQHQIKYCSIYNNNTQDIGTKIRFNDNGSYRYLSYIFLRVSESIQYTEDMGWRVYDVNGSEKTSGFNRIPASVRMPEFFGSNAVASFATVALTNGTAFCEYLGRAERPYSSINVRYRITTGIGATISWAEIGIYKATSLIMGTGSFFTRLGYTNVASVWGSTGAYTTNISTNNMAIGDELFVVFSSSTTGTVPVLRAGIADNLASGVYQTSGSCQPSLVADFTGSVNSGSAMIWTAWEGIPIGI